ncbi:MAG: cell filamentation protein [Bacteroidales bacterium]|jgi:cell filamentation protein|nr:cell filamentation protein [Bacteroidales bacterium]
MNKIVGKVMNKNDYLNAMIESHINTTKIKQLLQDALTNKIHDREIFITGIDYSYLLRRKLIDN